MNPQSQEALAKAALLNHLRAEGCLRRAAVISELAVERWARRADIVTVNGEIVAYEIKTAADRLSRLNNQIAAYSAVCDRVYAVVASKHMNAAISILPGYVGLKELIAFRGAPEIIDFREAAPSPLISLSSTLSLLPAKEIAKLVRAETGKAFGRRRLELELEATAIPLHAIRVHLKRFLKLKYRASTKLLKGGSARRRIAASDLSALSIWSKPVTPAPSEATTESAVVDWLTQLATTKAFGEVPDDIRALLHQ